VSTSRSSAIDDRVLKVAKVGLDAFGSDLRPGPEIEAALLAVEAGLAIELIGDRGRLEFELRAHAPRGGEGGGAIEVVHAPEQIAMDESPARAVRAKPDASLCVAVDRLATGELDAVVSAGNSGALLAAGLLRLGRLAGVDRPAIATTFPWVSHPTGHTVLLDAGANVECKILNLVQFAIIGAAYSRVEGGVERPRVAVLSNGAEVGKGTSLTRGTHEILSRWQGELGDQPGEGGFEFVGYIEPGELFSGACDVAVTDGWTGNVALKLAEAAMAAWPRMLHDALVATHESSDDREGADRITAAIAPALQSVSRRVDPEAHGGAPLLGVDGALIICHGAAGPRAILNALLMARRFAERGLTKAIGRALEHHGELFELARNLR
jgi:glycerol-3-phosphate acyltransferase PlsX